MTANTFTFKNRGELDKYVEELWRSKLRKSSYKDQYAKGRVRDERLFGAKLLSASVFNHFEDVINASNEDKQKRIAAEIEVVELKKKLAEKESHIEELQAKLNVQPCRGNDNCPTTSTQVVRSTRKKCDDTLCLSPVRDSSEAGRRSPGLKKLRLSV